MQPQYSTVHNRGTGAGGAETNRSGISFEEATNFSPILKEKGFTDYPLRGSRYPCLYSYKHGYNCYFVRQYDLKRLLISLFPEVEKCKQLPRPDEAMLLVSDVKVVLNVMEKKNQNKAGSVAEKIKGGPITRDVYREEIALCFNLGGRYLQVNFAYLLSDYLVNTYFQVRTREFSLIKSYGITIFSMRNSSDDIYDWYMQ